MRLYVLHISLSDVTFRFIEYLDYVSCQHFFHSPHIKLSTSWSASLRRKLSKVKLEGMSAYNSNKS